MLIRVNTNRPPSPRPEYCPSLRAYRTCLHKYSSLTTPLEAGSLVWAIAEWGGTWLLVAQFAHRALALLLWVIPFGGRNYLLSVFPFAPSSSFLLKPLHLWLQVQ